MSRGFNQTPQDSIKEVKKGPPKKSIKEALEPETLKPLYEIIAESEKATQMNSQASSMFAGKKQEVLPFRQARVLNKAFKCILEEMDEMQTQSSTYWKDRLSVDERSVVKKFFKDSNPHLKNLKDFRLEEFCTRLQARIINSGAALKHYNCDPDGLYLIISGKVGVYERQHD